MSPTPAILLFTALGGALMFAHWPALVGMVNLWARNPMYSYGYTVPAISLYLLWCKRERLAGLPPSPRPLIGGLVLAAGLLLLTLGRAASVQILEQLAFLVSLVGVVVFVFGVQYVRTAWAPIAYLLLMIPVWDAFTEELHLPFQHQSAAIGATLLQLTSVPAYRDGITIALPNVTLEVARTCSGVNYLVAVVALGCPLAYLRLRTTSRRLLLIAIAVLVAALSNGLRVALIGILAYLEIGSPLHGPFHVLHGLFVAGVGYVALFMGLRVLGTREQKVESSEKSAVRPSPSWLLPIRPVYAAVPAVVLAAVGLILLVQEARPVPLAERLEHVPMYLGRWSAEPMAPQRDWFTWWNGADEQLVRRYRSVEGTQVEVYVGYFFAQRQNKEVANYRSVDLHRRASSRSLKLPGGQSLQANLVNGSSRQPEPILFWYEIDGEVETSQYGAKVRTLWNALRRARTNGAVVALMGTPSTSAAADLEELAVLLHGALDGSLPGRSHAGAPRR